MASGTGTVVGQIKFHYLPPPPPGLRGIIVVPKTRLSFELTFMISEASKTVDIGAIGALFGGG